MKVINTILLTLSLVLASCATPDKLSPPFEAAGNECIEGRTTIDEALPCLSERGLNMKRLLWKGNLYIYSSSKCRPSSAIFVSACSGLSIIVSEQGEIQSWSVSKGYDGP